MSTRSNTYLWLPLLFLILTLAVATTVLAQDRHDRGTSGTSASLQVTFGRTPHWTGVPGTRVKVIRQGERPDYDMFRYGGSYYVYDNQRWYTSRRMRGGFAPMDEHAVPGELSRVPREHWHNYPSGWSEQNNDPHRGMNGRRH